MLYCKVDFSNFRKMDNKNIQKAIQGDINAFQELFKEFHDELKSYLCRLLASRAGAEDISHDTFIKAFDKLNTFKGISSLKTWVFQIATNLAYNELKKRKRWVEDVKSQAKELVISTPEIRQNIERVSSLSSYRKFEIKEHIDTCFTCMAKNLPIENQVALILKDIYDFSVKEIMIILEKTEGVVKYLIQNARKTMIDIFDRRCALVNKNGMCHQCSELNGWFNPKQNQQEAKMKIKMVRDAEKMDKTRLFQMRTDLVKAINPLKSEGNELQEVLLNCNRIVMGEMKLN